MIERIVPAAVVTAWRPDDIEPVTLFPEETAVLTRAVEVRRREFATVRLCARLALRALGLPATPLTPGPRGEPRWPAGVAGSMTHCAGYRAAALARTTDVLSIGIDAEPAGPLPEGVLDVVSLPGERRHLAELAARTPELPWELLLFSAKESVFKTWYPLTGRSLEFDEAAVEFAVSAPAHPAAPREGSFRARLLVPGPVAGGTRHDHFAGRWLVREGLVLTAIVLPR